MGRMSNRSLHRWVAGWVCAVACGPAALAAPAFKVLYHEAIHIQTQPAGDERQHMRLEAFGRQFELSLRPNDGIRRAVPAGRTDIQPLEGTIDGQAGSWVRITRTRAGWRGMVFDGRELYAIEPLGDVADALVQPHAAAPDTAPVMYRLADTLMTVNPGFCETLAAEDSPADAAAGGSGPAQTRPSALKVFEAIAADLNAQALQFPSKRLMTGVVADYEFASSFDDPEGAIIARMDIVDGIFSTQVGVKISLAPLTVIRTAQEPFTRTAASDLLGQLRSYRSHSSAQMALGVTHLMTGRNMDGDIVGIAYQGGVCNGATAASLSEGAHSTTMSALIAAHELGHNFNAPHDGVPGACSSTPQTFLMAPQINGSNQFSSCSLQQIQARIQTAQCLTDYVAPDVALTVPNNLAGVPVGTVFTLSYSVQASGDDASSDVVTTATIPANLTVQLATVAAGTCTFGAGTASCTIGSLAPGETREVDLQLAANATGTTTVSLEVGSSNDSNAGNDSGSVTTNVSETSAASGPPGSSGSAGGNGGGGGRVDLLLLAFLGLMLLSAARKGPRADPWRRPAVLDAPAPRPLHRPSQPARRSPFSWPPASRAHRPAPPSARPGR